MDLFFADKQITVAETYYAVSMNGKPLVTFMDRRGAARLVRMSRRLRGADTVCLQRQIITSTVPACPWCGARPCLLEGDCDGPYYTADCGSPQCRTGRLR